MISLKDARFWLLNPFFFYTLSFFTALFFYSLEWSDLYPKLSVELLLFLMFTGSVSLFLGFFLLNTIKKSFILLDEYKKTILISKENVTVLTYVIVFLIIAEYVYFGGIPIFLVFLGKEFNYQEFGIPTLHVLISPYLSVLSTTFFLRYLLSKDKMYLKPVLIIILYSISVYSRAGLFFQFVSFGILYLVFNFSIRKMFSISIFALVFLYLFGVIGDNRMKALGYGGESEGILILGQANKNFTNSVIPNQFFWSYLYISSPIANLQYKDNTYFYQGSISKYLMTNIVPDAISKRVGNDIEDLKRDNKLLDESLNVSTLYGNSMQTMYYSGSLFLFFYYIIFVCFFIFLTGNRFKLVSLVILCLMSILAIFDNLLFLSGFIMQLIFLLIFSRLTINKLFFI